MSLNPLGKLDAVWSEQSPFNTVTRAVYTRLVLRADKDTGWCYTSQGRIAKDTGLGISTVNRALDSLETAGWIARRRAPRPAATRYQILPQREYPTAGISHSGSQILPQRELDTPRAGDQLPQELPQELTALFEEAWSAYPKRPGNSKAGALRQWRARVKSGEDPASMIEGTRRYAAYVAAEKIEPRYVMQATKFFGRDEHWKSDYGTTTATGRSAGERTLYLRPSDMP